MKPEKPKKQTPSELCKRAEEKLKKTKITPPRAMSDKETRQLIHELQVHQIELEMQNEELRKAQTELEESRSKYSDLYDFAPVGYFTFDKQGLILDANFAAATELGVERSLLINKPFRAYIVTEDREMFDQHIRDVFKNENRQTCDIKLKKKNGSALYAQLASISANSLNGNILCRTSIIDITERKRDDEEKLLVSAAYWHTTFDTISDGISLIDLNGKILQCNKAFAELLGKPRTEIINNKCWELVHGTSEPIEGCPIGRMKIAGQRETLNFSMGERWFHISVDPIKDGNANLIGAVHIMSDITVKKKSEEALRESEERFRTLVESAPEALFVQSQGCFVYLNPAMLRLFGASTPEELLGKEFMEWIAPEYHEAVRERIQVRYETGTPVKLIEQEFLRLDGSRVQVEITAGAVRFQDRDAHLFFVRDISERKRTEQEMQKLTTAVEHSADWILITDQEGTIQYVNKAVESISGYTREEVIGKNPRIFKSGRHNREFFRDFWATILLGNTFSTILINRKKSGELFELHCTITPLKDQDGNVQHFVATAKDITEKKHLEERLDYMAYYDSLTGLPNKKLFADRLSQSLISAEPQSLSIAVVILDIDRFTSLNETFGYETGDKILKEAGRTLSQTTSRDYTLGRIDADKFGVILADIQHSEDVILVLENIRSAFKKPLKVDHEDIIITLSAGIALFPEDGKEPEVLMQNAEVALAKAKAGGINIYHFFTAGMNNTATEFIRMQRHLFNALDLNEFVMHYQPYFDSTTRRMVGMEALIRWNSTEFGLVLPGMFVPILEETGMIIDVGKWIIQTVCRQLRDWMDKGFKYSIVPVYVNLSLAQFAQRDLVEFIEKTIAEARINRSFLGVEITESIFMQDIQHTQTVLDSLRQSKISVNIDDFGTGYSSLSSLKRLPLNNLKIDTSFIRDVTDNPDDASIVITIISMAHNLNLKTIAEGVESEEQWKILRILKCDMVQGHYLSKPLPAEEIEELLIGGVNESKRRDKRCSLTGSVDLEYELQKKN